MHPIHYRALLLQKLPTIRDIGTSSAEWNPAYGPMGNNLQIVSSFSAKKEKIIITIICKL
jgi:hypothetical protein